MERTHNASPVALDQLDLDLVRLLEEDARQKNPALAAKLGISREAVRRRVLRLLDEGIIRFALGIQPEALGFQTTAVMGVSVYPGTLERTVRSLVALPRVGTLMTVVGRYDVILGAFFSQSSEVLSFVTEEVGGIPEVVSLQRMSVVGVMKNSWRLISDDNVPSKRPVLRPIDQSDMVLIREVERDPRASYIDIAARCGMNRSAVRRRLQVLQDDNIIYMGISADPAAFGYCTQAIILMNVHPSAIVSSAESLSAHRCVRSIILASGPFDLMVRGIFHDSAELSSFLQKHLCHISGITHYEILLLAEDVKQSFAV